MIPALVPRHGGDADSCEELLAAQQENTLNLKLPLLQIAFGQPSNIL
jgi:hypothetical protein